MILANIDWLTTSINLLLILFVFNCVLLSLLILMQRPKQEGLGAAFGSGMTDQVFGAQTTSVLQKGTVYLGVMFFVLTMTIAILYSKKSANEATLVRETAEQTEESAEATGATEESGDDSGESPAPVATEEPAEPSLEEQLGDALESTDPGGDASTEGEATPDSPVAGEESAETDDEAGQSTSGENGAEDPDEAAEEAEPTADGEAAEAEDAR